MKKKLKNSSKLKKHFHKHFHKHLEAKPSLSKRKGFIIFVSIITLVLVAILVYFNFFYYVSCENASCFKEMTSKCARAEFVSSELMTLENKIIGLSPQGCKIEVTLLEGLDISEGKQMTCYLPIGLKVLPQSKIEFCTGELREEIQTVIISELYETVGQNIVELQSSLKSGGSE